MAVLGNRIWYVKYVLSYGVSIVILQPFNNNCPSLRSQTINITLDSLCTIALQVFIDLKDAFAKC